MAHVDISQPRAALTIEHPEAERIGAQIRLVGCVALHAGLGIIFLWFGAMKVTSYEADGIAPFIMNSPIVGWWHALLGIQGASYFLGVVEVTTGLLLLARPISPLLSALGGAMGAVTFLITLSFFFTTPGVAEPKAGGFPAISALPGQFLLKDAGLLAISLFILGDSLVAWARLHSSSISRRRS